MEYTKLPGLTPDGTMYWNEELGTVEAMIPPGDYKTAHGPGLLELENGDLLCTWFAGSFEGNADVNVPAFRKVLINGKSQWRFLMTQKEASRIHLCLQGLTERYGLCTLLSYPA